MIPGANVLRQALTVIRADTVQYYRFIGRTTNPIGLDVSTYAASVDIEASVQAVPRSQYQRLGLDYVKRYIALWSVSDINDLSRGSSGDQLGYNGRRYELINEEDWTLIDGWNGTLAVEVGAETGA